MSASAPLPSAALASAGHALAAEFPDWEVSTITAGMWGAYWRSADGRHRRYLVAASAPELLARLRAIGSAQ
jgi:hypothetical protein